MKSFTQFLQDRVGATYCIRDILNNLPDDEIIYEIEEYVDYRTNFKKCSICHDLKPLSDFTPQSGGVKGVVSACKICNNNRSRVRYSRK